MGRIPPKVPGSVRLIAAADLHLGRVLPLPQMVKNFLIRPETTWEKIVDLTLDEELQIDALLLAGDLFDKEENLLEAPYAFEQGLKRLAKAQKPTVAIAGNHDFRSLRRRHRLLSFPSLHLLGLENSWESIDLSLGSQTIRIEGWSFPASEYKKNPLSFLPPPTKGITTIGLLHTDCDGNRDSPYAPCTSKELSESGRHAWVLGHIHVPRLLRNDPPIISCGSPQGLDPSEQGPHGVFIIDIDSKGALHTQMLPLASLLWQTITVDITNEHPENYEVLLQKTLEKIIDPWETLKVISIEVVWIGEAQNAAASRDRLKTIEPYFTLNKHGQLIDCHVHSSKIAIMPAIDLNVLSQEKTIAGLIAKNLLEIQSNSGFVSQARSFIEQTASRYPHFSLSMDEETLSKELRLKGYEILIELLKQETK